MSRPATCAPLAQLNAYLRSVSPSAADGGEELASARRFRESWQLAQAQDKLDLAALRRPAQAGPLNSHALVLEALAVVNDISPVYLRRLLGQVDSLQWLEQAALQYPARKTGRNAARNTGQKPGGKRSPTPGRTESGSARKAPMPE